MTVEEFIKKAKEVHGDKYDYSSITALSQGPVPIRCQIHGMFYAMPYMHLRDCGCLQCRTEYLDGILKEKRGV